MDNIYSANHTTVQASCVVTNPTGSIRYLFLGTNMLAIALQRIMYALIVVLILVSAKQYFCLYENRRAKMLLLTSALANDSCCI